MVNKLIDGIVIAEKWMAEIAVVVKTKQIKAKLSVILTGKNEASEIYVAQKIKKCAQVGFEAEIHRLENPSQDLVLKLIKELNSDQSVTGILLQLPVAQNLNKTELLEAIDPIKDVDGLHPVNIGKTLMGMESVVPCTALGVLRIFDELKINLEGKKICVIGSGLVAGRPIAAVMINQGATVSVLNSKTPDLSEFTKTADIVVSAAGAPKLVKDDMIKKGCIIIDVGINRLPDGKICGDADFESVIDKVQFISPVPGGVGRLTVSGLMANLLKIAESK